MAELKALSKLKKAGRLHYWRGTIEIDERELHAICDEIQAEHDRAVAAMNKAAGNWAKADALIRDMSEAFIHNNCFRWCEAQEPCNLISDGKCQYRERMNELGIYNAQPERLRGEGE